MQLEGLRYVLSNGKDKTSVVLPPQVLRSLPVDRRSKGKGKAGDGFTCDALEDALNAYVGEWCFCGTPWCWVLAGSNDAMV